MIEIRKNGDKKVNMLAPGMTRESHELLKQYQNILTQAELIATGEMQRYASRMKSYVQENGLYRQRVKKNINFLMQALADTQRDFFIYEKYTSIKSVTQSFPIYANDYTDEGESIGMKVQQSYQKRTSDKIQLMFFGYKQLFDRYKFDHSELVSAAYTITQLSMMARDVSKTVHTILDNIVYGYTTNKMPPLRILDKIETASREVLADVIRDKEMTCQKEELEAINELLLPIATALVDGKPVKDMLQAIAEHTFRYMDYCMVRLWMAAHNGLSDKEREALDELGVDADALMAQLSALPLPEEYDDVWDLQEYLPREAAIEGSPMEVFYMKCYERIPYLPELDQATKSIKEE